MSEIKAVVFDFDGVINKAKEKFNVIFEREFPDDVLVMNFFHEGAYSKCRVGKADVREEFARYVRGTSWSVDDIVEYWHSSDWEVDDELLGFISNLKKRGVKVFIATNQAKTRTDFMRGQESFDGVFDDIFASCDLFCEKPEREFFDKVFDEIQSFVKCERDEVLFFDDTLEHVVSANSCGLVNSFLYLGFDECVRVVKKCLNK